MEQFPLRRGTAVVAIALGAASMPHGSHEQQPTPEQSYSAANTYTVQDELQDMHQQRLDAQEAAAARERAAEHARASRSRRLASVATSRRVHHAKHYASMAEDMADLRQCESGGNYKANTGNGYYGAYQFELRTYHGLGYSGRPDLASPATQDAAARELQEDRGWNPWPACARKLGLFTHKYVETD